jgi:hypothetical protein
MHVSPHQGASAVIIPLVEFGRKEKPGNGERHRASLTVLRLARRTKECRNAPAAVSVTTPARAAEWDSARAAPVGRALSAPSCAPGRRSLDPFIAAPVDEDRQGRVCHSPSRPARRSRHQLSRADPGGALELRAAAEGWKLAGRLTNSVLLWLNQLVAPHMGVNG